MKIKDNPTVKKWLRRALRICGGGIALLLLFILSVRIGVFGRLPNTDEIKSIRNYLASEVYSENGDLLGKYFVQNRTGASLEEIPPSLIDALIATEDVRFREHNGVDYRALGRVIVKSIILQSSSSGGGSTITQQLVKNTYGRENFSFLSLPVAKVKEIFLAGRFEEVYSKDEIIELYLNTVSFGENIYGIETASQRFFNKKPINLTTEESAVLVGLLKGNTLYNPRSNPELAEERRNTVLDQMAKYEYITDTIRDSLKAIPLVINYYNLESENPASYFLAHIRPEVDRILQGVEKPDGSAYDLETDGLIVETTIDSRLQEYATSSVERHMIQLQSEFNTQWGNRDPWGSNTSVILNEVKKTRIYARMNEAGHSMDEILEAMSVPHPLTVVDLSEDKHVKRVEMSSLDSIKYYQAMLHTGFVAIEPSSGKVRAWVGGLNYQYLPYDHVTTRRQTASTFKPFVYGSALEQGVEPCDYFENIAVTYPDYEGYRPSNAGGDDSLYYSMKGALKNSLNVVSVKVLFEAGMENVHDFARRMGVTSPIRQVPSMALGTNEATLFEMTLAYCTFANRGKSITPRFINKITDARGNVLYTAPSPRTRVASKPYIIDQLTAMLQGVINEGTGASARSAYGLQREYAGKTGTAQNYSDGWFIGYSPNLVAGCWVGASNPSVHFRSEAYGSGAHMALPIWSRFFRSVERSSVRNQYTGSFAFDADSTNVFQCPDSRKPNMMERLGRWLDGEEPTDSTESDESWLERIFN